MSFIDKNMSQKDGEGNIVTKRSINVHTPQKRTVSKMSFKKILKKKWKAILTVAGILLIVFLAYGYITTKSDLEKATNPTQASQDAKQEVINKVGLLIVLPQNETPTLATVKDAESLRSQEFFARAQNGDKVLIYPNAGRAVLYRPSVNKVIEYSKVNLNPNQQ